MHKIIITHNYVCKYNLFNQLTVLLLLVIKLYLNYG